MSCWSTGYQYLPNLVIRKKVNYNYEVGNGSARELQKSLSCEIVGSILSTSKDFSAKQNLWLKSYNLKFAVYLSSILSKWEIFRYFVLRFQMIERCDSAQ